MDTLLIEAVLLFSQGIKELDLSSGFSHSYHHWFCSDENIIQEWAMFIHLSPQKRHRRWIWMNILKQYRWRQMLPVFSLLMLNAYYLFCKLISPGKRMGFCKALCFPSSLASLKAETCWRHPHSFMHIYCCLSIRATVSSSRHFATFVICSCWWIFSLPAYNWCVPILLGI